MLALAAWQRDDVHEAMRWLGGDIALLGTPLHAYVFDRLILSARVASAAGDAGLRARVLQATEVLEREQPAVPLLAGVAGYARGILERDAAGIGGCRGRASYRLRGRFFTQAPPRTPALSSSRTAQRRGARPAERGIRHLHRVRSDCRCPPGRPRAAPIRRGTAHRHPPAGKNGLGQPHRLRTHGRQPHRSRARPTATSRSSCTSPPTR